MAPLMLLPPQGLPRWNSEIVWSVNPAKNQFTCVGTTKPGDRCKNPIHRDNRSYADMALQKLCQQSPELIKAEDLAPLANRLLCWVHRDKQDLAKIAEWQSKLKPTSIAKAYLQAQTQANREDGHLENLQEQVRALKDHIQHWRADNVANAAGVTQLEDQLRKSKLQVHSLKNQNSGLEEALDSVNLRLHKERQASGQLQEQLDECKRIIEEKDKQLRLNSVENRLEIDALKEERRQKHEDEHRQILDHFHDELRRKDEALLDVARERDQLDAKLKQRVRNAVEEVSQLRAQSNQMRRKLRLHACWIHLQRIIHQRRYDELLADNQALRDQQKLLQQEMSRLDETSNPPLKLREGQKGIRAVMAAKPLGSKVKRLWHRNFSGARSTEEAVSGD
ncbi:MAG: hypothetical protein Q9163_004528 [Psora crenata]